MNANIQTSRNIDMSGDPLIYFNKKIRYVVFLTFIDSQLRLIKILFKYYIQYGHKNEFFDDF